MTWGDEAPADPVEIENVSLLVKTALNDDRNWTATFPVNSHSAVSMRALELPPEKIILHPFGVLAVSQKIVPLGYPLEKFGNKKPDVDRFELATAETGTEEQREEFAIAQFKKMSDADKLPRAPSTVSEVAYASRPATLRPPAPQYRRRSTTN